MLNWVWICIRKDGFGLCLWLINLGVWKMCFGWFIIWMLILERNFCKKLVFLRFVYRLVVLIWNNLWENYCLWLVLFVWFECKWSELYILYYFYFYNYVFKVFGLCVFMNVFWWFLLLLFFLNCRVNLSFNFIRFGFKIEE